MLLTRVVRVRQAGRHGCRLGVVDVCESRGARKLLKCASQLGEVRERERERREVGGGRGGQGNVRGVWDVAVSIHD